MGFQIGDHQVVKKLFCCLRVLRGNVDLNVHVGVVVKDLSSQFVLSLEKLKASSHQAPDGGRKLRMILQVVSNGYKTLVVYNPRLQALLVVVLQPSNRKLAVEIIDIENFIMQELKSSFSLPIVKPDRA